jgi:diketogulonate reductase-like aldo/keto reductase
MHEHPASTGIAVGQESSNMPNAIIPKVRLPDGREIRALGRGTWRMGETPAYAEAEAGVLRQGVELGLTLIDTAEMYCSGGAERVVAEAIAGHREKVFLVSKISPQNPSASGVARHCDASLKRLGTARIDLFLLHWLGPHPLAETVAAFERLLDAGKIAFWGVSNFDADAMAELENLPGGKN